MGWGEAIEYAKWLLGGWLFLLMAFILLRMLTGHILLIGLLRVDKHAPFGLDRLQLVFVTILFAAGYVVVSLARAPGDALPGIPTPLLLVLIGSNGTYLAGKYAALTSGRGRGR